MGSEWFGNPLLYAVENLFLRQAGFFLDHAAASAANWDHWSIRSTIRALSNFRIEGPTASIVMFRRLLGTYGPALEIYGPHNQNARYAEADSRYTASDDEYPDSD